MRRGVEKLKTWGLTLRGSVPVVQTVGHMKSLYVLNLVLGEGWVKLCGHVIMEGMVYI